MAKIPVKLVWPHIQRIFGLEDRTQVKECTIRLRCDQAVEIEIMEYAVAPTEDDAEAITTRFVVTEIIEDD